MLPCVMGAGDRVPNNLPIDGHSFRRVEVLTGTPRRRRWSDEEKAAIVAESLAPGARTSEIALRHGLHRNQLYDWRRQFRLAAVADAGLVASDFVPVVVLIWKRLEGSKFSWPAISDGVMRLSAAQLAALFEGLDWRRVYAPRIRRPQLAG